MRHAPSRLPALAAAAVLAGALIAPSAQAQTAPASSGEVAGLRYLSWPGKAVRQTPARVAAASTPSPRASALSAPQPVEIASTRPEASPRQGLTPASAFYTPGASLGGRFGAEPAPAPAPMPAPALQAASEPEPEPQAAPEPRMRRVAPSPLEAASTHASPPPAPVAQVHSAPLPRDPAVTAPTAETAPAPTEAARVADPMAPRRDAPIFRLQRQTAPAPALAGAEASQATPSTVEPAASGARYYSVHRQHGQRPDAIAAPEPAWLDAMPVQLATAPAASTTDLAAPPAAPALRRDASGKLQPAAPLVSGDPS